MRKKPRRRSWPEAKKLGWLNRDDIAMVKRSGYIPMRWFGLDQISVLSAIHEESPARRYIRRAHNPTARMRARTA
jgi:hypothetical protein